MLYLLLTIVVVILIAAILILMCAYANIFVGWPKTNKDIVILKGKQFCRSISTNVNGLADTVTDTTTGVKTTTIRWEPIPAWENLFLYKPFGLRWFGWPFIHSTWKDNLFYPEEISSIVGGTHVNGNLIEDLDGTHTYRLILSGTEFQIGNKADLIFNLEIRLVNPYAAVAKGGRFLDALAQGLSSRVRQVALRINITEFLGKTAAKASPAKKKSGGAKPRAGDPNDPINMMCAECMRLNEDARQSEVPGQGPIGIGEMSGYEIKVITYQDMKVTDPATLDRLRATETLAERKIGVQTAIEDRKIKEQEAIGLAAVTKEELGARAEGAAKMRVALGNDHNLFAEKMRADSHVDALKESGATTLMIGGNMAQPVFPVGGALVSPAAPTPALAPTTPAPRQRSGRSKKGKGRRSGP